MQIFGGIVSRCKRTNVCDGVGGENFIINCWWERHSTEAQTNVEPRGGISQKRFTGIQDLIQTNLDRKKDTANNMHQKYFKKTQPYVPMQQTLPHLE